MNQANTERAQIRRIGSIGSLKDWIVVGADGAAKRTDAAELLSRGWTDAELSWIACYHWIPVQWQKPPLGVEYIAYRYNNVESAMNFKQEGLEGVTFWQPFHRPTLEDEDGKAKNLNR